MKQCYYMFLIWITTVLIVGCMTLPVSEPVSDPNLPDFVRNPPLQEDTIFGIGSAKINNINLALTTADARARQSLAFQLNANVQAMINSYVQSSGTKHSSSMTEFTENVSRQLTLIDLRGARLVKRTKTLDGTVWALVAYPKNDAAKIAATIIEQEASRYAEFKALDALKMVTRQLEKITTKPSVVSQ